MRLLSRLKTGIRNTGKRSHLLGDRKIRQRQRKKLQKINEYNKAKQNRQLRNSQHPLKIIFVCSEGFSSGALAKRLSEISRQKHLPISSTNSHVALEIHPKSDKVKYRPDEDIKHEIRGADIVIHPFREGSWSLSKLLKCTPQKATILTYKDANSGEGNLSSLLKLIFEKYRFQ